MAVLRVGVKRRSWRLRRIGNTRWGIYFWVGRTRVLLFRHFARVELWPLQHGSLIRVFPPRCFDRSNPPPTESHKGPENSQASDSEQKPFLGGGSGG